MRCSALCAYLSILCIVDASALSQGLDSQLGKGDLSLAWTSNYEKLGAVELSLSIEKEYLNGRRKEQKVREDGTIAVVDSKLPSKTVRVAKAVVFGPQLVFEQLQDVPSPKFYYDGAYWTEYSSLDNLAIIRRPDQLTPAQPMDLREKIFYDPQTPFSDALDRYEFVFDPVAKPKSEGFVFVFDRFNVAFDPKQGLLPTHSRLIGLDGTPLQETSVDYDFLESRDAYYPVKVVSDFFSNGKSAIRIITTVSSVRTLDAPRDGKLAFTIPVGTKIIDLANGVYKNEELPTTLPSKSPMWPLLGTLVVIVAILVGKKYLNGRAKL